MLDQQSHHCGASRSASGDHPSFSWTEACWTNLVNMSRFHQWSYQHLVISKQIGWVKGCLEKWQKNLQTPMKTSYQRYQRYQSSVINSPIKPPIANKTKNRGWPEAVALLSQLRPSSLEVQDFARTFCVTQKMPWSFLVRKRFWAKVLWIPGLVPFWVVGVGRFSFGVKMMDTSSLLGWQRLPFDQRLVKESL